ncbi:DUF1285 domain-containing protein [Sphingomonas sp. GM_Shp_1]|uniref:DUF1285 domain-containing protein n=1 Tax=Sphingomonas sp. GM_Shp_1 TaxID=2937381 RepID=UPI00226B0EFC|nr:DUF1285 domain-containing protein [Sphingomonas sp. GM_Shp_1]
MPMAPPPDLSSLSLAEIVQAMEAQKLPPVSQWNPSHCGDSEMRIARDGTWFHQGSPITRPAMVRLFSTILRREPDGRHVLVTPVEKLDIAVEDAPFVAVTVKAEGEGRDGRLVFQLNTGDLVAAGPAHPLRVVQGEDGPRPYLLVRDGLEALIARPVYYELAERALVGDDQVPGVWSDGVFFPLADATAA